MCYCNCPFESYPCGQNERCVCKKPKGIKCYLDCEDNENYPEYDFEYEEEQEDVEEGSK